MFRCTGKSPERGARPEPGTFDDQKSALSDTVKLRGRISVA